MRVDPSVGAAGFPRQCASFSSGPSFRLARLLGGYAFRASEEPNALVLSPDETTLYLLRSEVVAFDAHSGERRAAFSLGDSALAASAAMARDGGRILVGRNDGHLALYDLARGAVVWDVFATTLDAPAAQSVAVVPPIRAVALAADGTTAASFAETEAVVRVFRGGTPLGSVAGTDPVAFSPDGAVLWAGASLYDAAGGQLLFQTLDELGRPRAVEHVAFSPRGGSLAAASRGGAVECFRGGHRVWSAAMPPDHSGKPAEPTSLGFGVDGRDLVSTSHGTYQIWDGATGALARQGRFPGDKPLVAPMSGSLFGASSTAIRKIDLASGEPRDAGGHLAPVTAIACAPRAPIAATADRTGTVIVWHVEHAVALRTLTGYGEIVRVAFCPDGRRLAVLFKSAVRVWDVATSELLLKLDKLTDKTSGLRDATDMDVSPDGTRLVLCNEDGQLRLVDMASKTEMWRHKHDARYARFTRDGRIVASCSGALRTLAAVTGDRVGELAEPERVRSQPFALLRGEDGVVLVRTTEGALVRGLTTGATTRLGESKHALRLLAASPHTALAAFTTSDRVDAYQPTPRREVELWSTATGAHVATIDLASSDDEPASGAFSADGLVLFVGTVRGVVLVFEIAPRA